ncbi:hypothetical protein [Motilimonas pumila]|uniref:Uncharacterized protein n=1 Tax=Motilimonas pumila TaxID=2303987 RepID=A0A418YIK5_9GAMM|nr:hypothetical protein [Motilimonas pumila]RJG50481.1 hypothetical protein D1Z90_03095 [Motilimonas pumila]
MPSIKTISTTLILSVSILSGCGGDDINLTGKPEPSSGTGSSENTAEADLSSKVALRVAIENSPFAENLVKCVQADQASNSCSIDELPFIYHTNSNPSIQDVMDRLVVSDDWMKTRFQQLLEHPNTAKELLPLFQSVRAVVIASDIRPAYFNLYTGAIYIDPYYLWTTNAEKNTINKEADYRGEYSKTFDFSTASRFVYDNQYLFNFSLFNSAERSIDQVVVHAATVLFHELAHARDIFHDSYLANISADDVSRLSQLVEAHRTNFEHKQLFINTFELHDSTMKRLSQALYGGAAVTDDLKALRPEEVGYMLESEGANDQYAYYHSAEDLAMLFEESMMKLIYRVDRDVAYTSNPDEYTTCNDRVVAWGQRNRIAASEVRPRAHMVTKRILANATANELLAVDEFFNNLGSPTALPLVGWCDSINPISGLSPRSAWPEPDVIEQDFRPRHY